MNTVDCVIKEVKELVRQKKLTMWKEVVEKINVDYEGSRKKFWAFCW